MKLYCKTEHVCFSVSAAGNIVYNCLQMGSEQRHTGVDLITSRTFCFLLNPRQSASEVKTHTAVISPGGLPKVDKS